MKRTLFIILLLTLKSYSQDFIGKWKAFSYEDEMVYYNKSTDSISYKITVEKQQPEILKQALESLIFSVTYSFENNGKYTLDFPTLGETENGNFKVDKQNKKIMTIDNEGKKDEMPYIYKDGVLFVRMEMENGFIKLGLTKVSN